MLFCAYKDCKRLYGVFSMIFICDSAIRRTLKQEVCKSFGRLWLSTTLHNISCVDFNKFMIYLHTLFFSHTHTFTALREPLNLSPRSSRKWCYFSLVNNYAIVVTLPPYINVKPVNGRTSIFSFRYVRYMYEFFRWGSEIIKNFFVFMFKKIKIVNDFQTFMFLIKTWETSKQKMISFLHNGLYRLWWWW